MHKIIFGLGIDIIEVDRIKSAINRYGRFLTKVFTPVEIKYCESKKNPAVKYISYAEKFAAKEAVAKSLGVGFGKNLSFCEIEVKNLSSGKPVILLSGKAKEYCIKNKIGKIEVSLSGTKNYAVAFSIAMLNL
ncbi:MAG: holo-[acyl-carrier-protein] synthase [Actinobacteria bacterium]|nr:holo-[acyl-carrier-protein] synthase [Actinomycetota bacterium]MBM3712742.1 holo-[acyl-carrier-protein] synthase [Actinomycetota bacterium]